MHFLHFYSLRLKYFLLLAVVFSLFSCSEGGGTEAESGGSNTAVYMVSLSWLAPTERENGTGPALPIVLSDIAGYRIYYGTVTGDYRNQFDLNDGSAVQVQISGIPSGTYYAVVTVVDTKGLESAYSSEVVVTAVKIS